MATAIIYGGPSTAVTAPDGTVFPIGVSVPVSDDLAASLLLQNFTVDKASAPAPTALSGPAEAPAIQAPAPAVSVAPVAAPADVPAAPVLQPSTGV